MSSSARFIADSYRPRNLLSSSSRSRMRWMRMLHLSSSECTIFVSCFCVIPTLGCADVTLSSAMRAWATASTCWGCAASSLRPSSAMSLCLCVKDLLLKLSLPRDLMLLRMLLLLQTNPDPNQGRLDARRPFAGVDPARHSLHPSGSPSRSPFQSRTLVVSPKQVFALSLVSQW